MLLLIGAIYVVQREFRHLRLKDIGAALSAIPANALLFSFVWTILSYFILTFYDRLGTIYAGHKVSYGKVAFASFCAYALSHNLGFAAVSGAAVRYRLYAHWGLTPLQIGKTVAFCSLTFGLGGMVLGGAILFMEPRAIPFFGQHLPPSRCTASARCSGLIVLGYVTFSKVLGHIRLFGNQIELPGWRMAIVQVLLATVDVAVTATIFYALLPKAPGLTWLIFLGVYVASYTAGLAANLPGGIGVFDTAMLFGLAPYMDAPPIVGAILVFRLYYYIIPLFLAGSLFAGNEILLRGGGLLKHVGGGSAPVQAIGRWSEPDFAVTAATGAVGLCGALMLCLGVLAPQTDFSWLDPDYAEFASQAGQFVPVADRRRPGADGDRPVAPGQPRLGADHPAADHRGRLRRDAGQPALGRRHPGADHAAAGAVPRLLLPPRPYAHRAAAAGQRAVADRAGGLPDGAGGDPAAYPRCCRTTPSGWSSSPAGAQLRPRRGRDLRAAGPDRALAAGAARAGPLPALGRRQRAGCC